MSVVQKFVQPRSATLMLLLISGGFVMILAELLLSSHTTGPQLVGVIASGVGLLLTLVALFAAAPWRKWTALLLLLLGVSGVLGIIQHNRGEEPEQVAVTATVATTADIVNQPIAYQVQTVSADRERTSAVPPLAPLSLTGFALMAAVATLGKQDGMSKEL